MLTALFVAHLLTLCIVAGGASVLRACERWSCSAELTMPTTGPWRYNVDNGARWCLPVGRLLFSVRNPFRTVRDRCASFGDPRHALTRNGVDVYRTVPLTAMVQRTWPPRPNPWPLRRRMFAGWIDAQRHAFQVRALLTYNALRYRSGAMVRWSSLFATVGALGLFSGSAGAVGFGALVCTSTVAFVAWYTYAAHRLGVGTVPGLAMVLPHKLDDNGEPIGFEWNYIDHGCEHSQFWRGAGPIALGWDGDVATGIGETLAEALDDALEMACQCIESDAVRDALCSRIEALIGSTRRDGDDHSVDDWYAAIGETRDPEECEMLIYATVCWSVPDPADDPMDPRDFPECGVQQFDRFGFSDVDLADATCESCGAFGPPEVGADPSTLALSHPMLIFSDYGGAYDVGASNCRVIDRMIDAEELDHSDVVEIYGGHGTRGYYFKVAGGRNREAVVELLSALATYPLLDEDDHSHLEIETEDDSWTSWGAGDFVCAMVKTVREDLGDDAADAFNDRCDELDDGEMWTAYRLYCEDQNRYGQIEWPSYYFDFGGDLSVAIDHISDTGRAEL